jgi:hypothetical protein
VLVVKMAPCCADVPPIIAMKQLKQVAVFHGDVEPKQSLNVITIRDVIAPRNRPGVQSPVAWNLNPGGS